MKLWGNERSFHVSGDIRAQRVLQAALHLSGTNTLSLEKVPPEMKVFKREAEKPPELRALSADGFLKQPQNCRCGERPGEYQPQSSVLQDAVVTTASPKETLVDVTAFQPVCGYKTIPGSL